MTNRTTSSSTYTLAGYPVPMLRGAGFVVGFVISCNLYAIGRSIIAIVTFLAASYGRFKVCGAKGASKTVVTDYRFVGPAFGTHKPVGWAGPQTPQAPKVASA